MTFTPRTTEPDANDLRWIQTGSGGYNQCIYGSDGPPSVLPDCTGYVHGRVMEIRGVNTDDAGLSFGNGVTYWSNSTNDWIREQEPSLGAVACYFTNDTGDANPGHVGIVEEIIDSNTIVISESNWGGPRWRLITCYRQYGWRPSSGWNVSPQGFLRNPYVDGGGGGGISGKLLLLIMKWRSKHGKRVTRTI